MRDPFPIPPPQPLVSLIKPLADKLSLSTLPLHAHEVLFALGLYTFIHTVVSPFLSNLICGARYRALTPRTKINWDVHVVSFCQACIICGLSLYIILCDEERKSWREPSRWEDRVWAYSGMTGLCQSFALGYFLWDLCMCSWHVDIFGWGMFAHAVSAVSVFALGYRPYIYFYCPVFLLYELSSPFLNIHWFCDKLDLTGSPLQAINGAVLTLVFFLSRIVWGQYSSYCVFKDMYTAYTTGHSLQSQGITPSQAFLSSSDGEKRTVMSGEIGLYYAGTEEQRTAFMGNEFLPLWLPLVYLASNLVLNALNVFWFAKMIETIRKRFDPPFGTKGIGSDDVGRWQPADPAEEKVKNIMGPEKTKAKVQQLHDAGKGSVAAGRKMAEKALDGDVDVQRGIYADGHKSIEVTGTTRRSARSRRKA